METGAPAPGHMLEDPSGGHGVTIHSQFAAVERTICANLQKNKECSFLPDTSGKKCLKRMTRQIWVFFFCVACKELLAEMKQGQCHHQSLRKKMTVDVELCTNDFVSLRLSDGEKSRKRLIPAWHSHWTEPMKTRRAPLRILHSASPRTFGCEYSSAFPFCNTFTSVVSIEFIWK